MDTGVLHVLHDGGDEDVASVADGVDLRLLTEDILVHKHRGFLIERHRITEVMAQVGLVAHDHHGTAAQHETRAHQHRIADLGSGRHAVFHAGNSARPGLRDARFAHDLLELLAVFCAVDGLQSGTDNGNAEGSQRTGQVDGRLTAE